MDEGAIDSLGPNAWKRDPALIAGIRRKTDLPRALAQLHLDTFNLRKATDSGGTTPVFVFTAVIGHEMTHGFDDQGARFDGTGDLRDWWTTDDAKRFAEREQCFADEYGDFTVLDGLHVNGRLTLGENTADNGGLRIAHSACGTRSRRRARLLAPRTSAGSLSPSPTAGAESSPSRPFGCVCRRIRTHPTSSG